MSKKHYLGKVTPYGAVHIIVSFGNNRTYKPLCMRGLINGTTKGDNLTLSCKHCKKLLNKDKEEQK